MKKLLSSILILVVLCTLYVPVFAANVVKFVKTPDEVATGFITHEDQEVRGLGFNIRVEYQGYQYVRVSGPEENVDDWCTRHHGTFVSEAVVIAIENGQDPSTVVEATPAPTQAPVATQAPADTQAPAATQAPANTQAPAPTSTTTVRTDAELRLLLSTTETRIIQTPDEVAEGFITHEDQEVRFLKFNIRADYKGYRYVEVTGPVEYVYDWCTRHHGVMISTLDLNDILIAIKEEAAKTPIPTVTPKPTETPTIEPTETPAIEPTETPATEEIFVAPTRKPIEAEVAVVNIETTKNSINLSWDISKSQNAMYKIYRKASGIDYAALTDFPIFDLEYIDYKVLPGVEYTYKVAIVYENGKLSECSEEVTAMIKSKKLISLQIGKGNIKVNGNNKQIDNSGTAPVVIDGRTLLPIRSVVESLGGNVEWDGTEFKVTITLNDKTIILYIDKNKAFVNGEEKLLDVAPMIKNNRTFVPLRFVAENLGCDVRWEGFTQTVTISQ